MPKRKVIIIYESPSSGKELQKFLDQGYSIESSFKFSGSGKTAGLIGDSYTLVLVKDVGETFEQRWRRKNGVKGVQ